MNDNVKTLKLIIDKKIIAEAYKKELAQQAEKITIKGFRKGKAPLDEVEKTVGKQKIIGALANKLVPERVTELIKKENAKPIISPRLKPVKVEEGEDWEFEVVIIEKPEFDLGDWKARIKKVGDKSKIIEALMSGVELKLPDFLIQEEVNYRLSQLVDQVAKIGMKIEQYLASKKLSTEQLRAKIAEEAESSLKLNFVLDKLADEFKLEGKDRWEKTWKKITDLVK